jgi:hypothetical protein
MRRPAGVSDARLEAVLAGIFTAAVVLYLGGFGTGPARLALKPVPVIALAAWVSPRNRTLLGRRVTAGLLLSALGDVLLEAGRFLPGLVAFLAAHVAYVVAFVSDERRLRLARLPPFAAWTARGRGGPGPLLIARLSPTGEPVEPEPLPAPKGDARFDYASWSRDGKRLAGLLLHASGRRTLAIHVLGSRAYEDLDVDAQIPVAWLHGDRDLLFLRHGRLRTVEIATKRARDVVVPAASAGAGVSSWISAFDLSPDRDALFVLRSRVYGEIWQITPP